MDAELDLLPAASLNWLRHRAAHQLGAQSLCGQLTKWTAISQGARFVLSLEIDFVGAQRSYPCGLLGWHHKCSRTPVLVFGWTRRPPT
jgi:hypothetical protein